MSAEQEQRPNESDPGSSQPSPPTTDTRIADLREMGEDSAHLDEVIDDAREAVEAARRADSMRSPGTQNAEANANANEAEPQSSD